MMKSLLLTNNGLQKDFTTMIKAAYKSRLFCGSIVFMLITQWNREEHF